MTAIEDRVAADSLTRALMDELLKARAACADAQELARLRGEQVEQLAAEIQRRNAQGTSP